MSSPRILETLEHFHIAGGIGLCPQCVLSPCQVGVFGGHGWAQCVCGRVWGVGATAEPDDLDGEELADWLDPGPFVDAVFPLVVGRSVSLCTEAELRETFAGWIQEMLRSRETREVIRGALIEAEYGG